MSSRLCPSLFRPNEAAKTIAPYFKYSFITIAFILESRFAGIHFMCVKSKNAVFHVDN